MSAPAGKLTNKDSGEALAFSLNPTEYRLHRQFEVNVESCVGQAAPMVAYRGGGATQLSFSLRYDKDADPKCDPKKIGSFLKGLNKVDEAKKSTPLVEFTMGSFSFVGLVQSVTYLPTRFDDKADVTSAKLDFTLVSNGDYENGK